MARPLDGVGNGPTLDQWKFQDKMEILYHRRPYVVSIFLEIEPWKMGHTLLIEEILHQKDAWFAYKQWDQPPINWLKPYKSYEIIGFSWDVYHVYHQLLDIATGTSVGTNRYLPTAGRSGPRRSGGGRRDAADDGAERRPGRTAAAAAAKADGGHGRPTPGATWRRGDGWQGGWRRETQELLWRILISYIYIYIYVYK